MSQRINRRLMLYEDKWYQKIESNFLRLQRLKSTKVMNNSRAVNIIKPNKALAKEQQHAVMSQQMRL